jgi:hypothetical protein
MSATRTFKISKVNGKSPSKPGNFTGSPSRAASKAFSSLPVKSKAKEIIVCETTQGSKKKVSGYRVSRKLLKSPKIVERDGVKIVYKYETKIKSLKKSPRKSVKKA